MPVNLGSRRALVAIGLGGLLISLAILARRNLYEDEWLSLAFMQRSLGDLWRWTFDAGCHPPGAMALDWIALQRLAPRAIAALHLIVWFVAVGYFVSRAQPLLVSGAGRGWLAGLAFLHPQSLMWAGTLRWYAPWWAVALAVLAAGLLPRRDDRPPSWPVTVGLGVAGAALLYMDYLAFIFLPCFAVAWLVRYGLSRASLARLAAIAATATLVAWPVATAPPTRASMARCAVEARDLLGSVLHMGHGLTIGEAIMPWHPVALLTILGLLIPCGWRFARTALRTGREPGRERPAARRELASLACFVLLMVAGAIVSGLGTKPRSFLGLATLMALPIAIGAERVTARRGRAWLALVAALWIATGAYHLIARTGTAKRQLNDRPEQVIAEIEGLADHGPALVFTSSLVLTFEINERRVHRATPLVVCSTWNDPVHGYPPGLPANAGDLPRVLAVEDADVGGSPLERTMAGAMSAARALILDPRQTDVGHDADAELKSRLGGRHLESHRFRVWSGRPAAGDWEAVSRQFRSAAANSLLGDGL